MSILCCIPRRRVRRRPIEYTHGSSSRQIHLHGYQTFYRELLMDTLLDRSILRSDELCGDKLCDEKLVGDDKDMCVICL